MSFFLLIIMMVWLEWVMMMQAVNWHAATSANSLQAIMM
jgi:hypothetical protein